MDIFNDSQWNEVAKILMENHPDLVFCWYYISNKRIFN